MKVGITGCAGRMGRMLIKTVTAQDGCAVVGGVEYDGSPEIGKDLGVLAGIEPLSLQAGFDTEALFSEADVVVDFTLPMATSKHVALAVANKTALVLGTTGITKEIADEIETASKKTAIVWTGNYSLGVNLLSILVEQAASALGDDFDIDIVEMHHRHKIDAPSGTALLLGKSAAEGRKVDFDQVSCLSREGQTGARPRGEIGFATLRGGDVTGEHTVMFAADGERIELTHKASNREVFARGAVAAAKWVHDKEPGLYNMKDVLGL
jgi:4-hydroxy-tetrahydrodipicolinate reductase